MQGTLFRYGHAPAQIAFRSSPAAAAAAAAAPSPSPRRCLVLVGGLTDGLLGLPYAAALAQAVGAQGWELVQASLSSSYAGWGAASLDQDADELRQLSDCLQAGNSGGGGGGGEMTPACLQWVLMGHSTGCQDAVRYAARHCKGDGGLAGVILQAPVSDREYFRDAAGPGGEPAARRWAERAERARALMADGRGEEVACRVTEWDGSALTARRLLSLYEPGGDDDMFSTDLPASQIDALVGGPLRGLPALILQSGADECVPAALRESGAAAALGERLLAAVRGDDGGGDGDSKGGLQRLRVIDGAPHNAAGHEAELVRHVCKFLAALPAPPTPSAGAA